MSHNSTNVLRRGSLGSSVVERVCLIGEQATGHACKDLKTMGEGINPALYARVVIERVVIEVAELRGVSLESGALEEYGDVGFDKGSVLEGHEALKTLHEEDDIPILYVFSY